MDGWELNLGHRILTLITSSFGELVGQLYLRYNFLPHCCVDIHMIFRLPFHSLAAEFQVRHFTVLEDETPKPKDKITVLCKLICADISRSRMVMDMQGIESCSWKRNNNHTTLKNYACEFQQLRNNHVIRDQCTN